MKGKEILVEMLRLHETEESLSIAFATENYDELKNLWEEVLSSYHVTKMVVGNVRSRRVFPGVLTPAGVEKARSLNQ